MYNVVLITKLLFFTEIFPSEILMIFDIEIIFESPILALFDLTKNEMICLLVICNIWAFNFDCPSMIYFTLNYSNATVQ